MKVVVVGFKATEENSVHYAKFTTDGVPLKDIQFQAAIAGEITNALVKGADQVWVRFIR